MPIGDNRTTKRILSELLEQATAERREAQRALRHEEAIGRSIGRREEKMASVLQDALPVLERLAETSETLLRAAQDTSTIDALNAVGGLSDRVRKLLDE